MSESFSTSAKIITIGQNLREIPKPLLHKLIQFTEQHYHIENTAIFINSVLRPQQTGDIIVFYGDADELVGYTRIYQQQLDIKNKHITMSSSKAYNNQTHNTSFTAARLALTQTMKYKLSHPEEELVHFSSVSTASKYHFLARLSNTIYPKPDSDVPNIVLNLVTALKETNNWPSCSTHPMLISEQLPRKHKPTPEAATDDPLTNYYLSLNPDDMTERDLLVCIPLNLGNIGHSIRQLLTHPHEPA